MNATVKQLKQEPNNHPLTLNVSLYVDSQDVRSGYDGIWTKQLTEEGLTSTANLLHEESIERIHQIRASFEPWCIQTVYPLTLKAYGATRPDDIVESDDFLKISGSDFDWGAEFDRIYEYAQSNLKNPEEYRMYVWVMNEFKLHDLFTYIRANYDESFVTPPPGDFYEYRWSFLILDECGKHEFVWRKHKIGEVTEANKPSETHKEVQV